MIRRVALAVCMLTLAVAALGSAPEGRKAAPAFALRDQSGKLHELDKLRGKVVVLDFGRVICMACQQALVDLRDIERQYRGKNVAVYSVNLGVPPEIVKRFVSEKKLQYPFLEDPGYEVTRKYEVRTIPYLVVIDKKGRISRASVGHSPEFKKQISQEIDRLLAEK